MDISEARAIRDARATLLGDLREQRKWIEEVLHDPPRCLRGGSVGKTLRAVHRLGETKVRTILNESKVDFDRKVGSLTVEEVNRIIDALPLVARKRTA